MKFFTSLWTVLSVLYSLFFLAGCFSRFVPPSTFQYISFSALAFPVLFIGQVFNTIISFFIQRRTAFFCFICLCFSYWNLKASVAFHSKKFDVQKEKNALRILTWNVQYFLHVNGSPSPEIVNVIKSYSPDILCLQDYSGIKSDIAKQDVQKQLAALGFQYQLITDSAGNSYDGVAIMSKYKFASTQTPTADTATGEKMAIADIVMNNDTIRVHSVHLQSYSLFADTSGTHSRLGNYKIGYQRKRYFIKRIRDIEKIHERQVIELKRMMTSSNYPVIFCGDINSVPASYTYSELASGMKDSHTEKGYFLGGTYFHLFPTLRIDVCLVAPSFNVLQTTVDQHKLSDHKAVITDLTLKR